jgi:two-component system sensor histidine kinase TctE
MTLPNQTGAGAGGRNLDKRSVLATEIVKGVMLPQFVILPLAVLLVWLALVQAIKPLNQLEERIRARSPDDLSPLDAQAVPQEVAPLVASVNDLLMRLKDSIATKSAFWPTPRTSSRRRWRAAHAGRPGAARRRQRRRPQAVAAPDRPLQHPRHPHRQPVAGAGARRRQRHRHEHASRATWPPDHGGGARLRAARHGQTHRPGLRRRQPGTMGARCMGNPTLLKEMVRNLVDNAINYTPSSMATSPAWSRRGCWPTLRQGAGAAGGGLRPRHSRWPNASWCSAFLPRAGHRGDGSGLGCPS